MITRRKISDNRLFLRDELLSGMENGSIEVEMVINGKAILIYPLGMDRETVFKSLKLIEDELAIIDTRA